MAIIGHLHKIKAVPRNNELNDVVCYTGGPKPELQVVHICTNW